MNFFSLQIYCKIPTGAYSRKKHSVITSNLHIIAPFINQIWVGFILNFKCTNIPLISTSNPQLPKLNPYLYIITSWRRSLFTPSKYAYIMLLVALNLLSPSLFMFSTTCWTHQTVVLSLAVFWHTELSDFREISSSSQ